MNSYVEHWVHFCKSSKRGLIGLHNVESVQEEDVDELEKLCEEGTASAIK
ncbi:MAG: hypothetical protein JSS09_07590 [Verrucomicrobia bacterium]|nr:hypothetical protein [Verrucomicrobiota bacterium]